MSGSTAERDGRGRSVDATINLVPCMDLFSGLIAFLLMTAAWTQVATLQAGGQGHGDGAPSSSFLVDISRNSVTVELGARREVFGLSDLPVRLRQFIAQERGADASLRQATVRSDDDVAYEAVVAVMDSLASQGVSTVTVTALR